jgi:hypothetical protein
MVASSTTRSSGQRAPSRLNLEIKMPTFWNWNWLMSRRWLQAQPVRSEHPLESEDGIRQPVFSSSAYRTRIRLHG